MSLNLLGFFRYREAGVSDWNTIPVTPSGSTQVTINRLSSGTTYEFQVVGKNALGDGMLSKVITVRTLGKFLPVKHRCLKYATLQLLKFLFLDPFSMNVHVL